MQVRLISFLLIFLYANPASALTFTYSESGWGEPQIYLEGPVEHVDQFALEKALAKHPDVRWVVVGQSPGGSLYAGIAIADIIYEKGLAVSIEGPAASAATLISLGARSHFNYWEGGTAAALPTQLLFHCAYRKGEDNCDATATRHLSETLAKLTGRAVENWFSELMTTSPSTTVTIPLERILSYGRWECDWDNGYKDCWRGTLRQGVSLQKITDQVLFRSMVRLTAAEGEEVMIDGVLFKGTADAFNLSGENFVSHAATGTAHKFERFALDQSDLPWCQYYVSYSSPELGHSEEEFAFDLSTARFSWDETARTINLEGASVVWPEVPKPADLPKPASYFVSGDGVIHLPYGGSNPKGVVRSAREVSRICTEIKARSLRTM